MEFSSNFPAATTTETLSKLNITIDSLPQRCQQLLETLASTQAAVDIEQLDPIGITLHQTSELSQQLDDDYEILKLKQKNKELQSRIDRNNKFLEDLRKELEFSRKSLSGRDPNPDNIQEYVRQLKQKVASYDESCEKAKAKYNKLQVPDDVTPKQLTSLVEIVIKLEKEEAELKMRADDITLAREARHTLQTLRR